MLKFCLWHLFLCPDGLSWRWCKEICHSAVFVLALRLINNKLGDHQTEKQICNCRFYSPLVLAVSYSSRSNISSSMKISQTLRKIELDKKKIRKERKLLKETTCHQVDVSLKESAGTAHGNVEVTFLLVSMCEKWGRMNFLTKYKWRLMCLTVCKNLASYNKFLSLYSYFHCYSVLLRSDLIFFEHPLSSCDILSV